ncbi:MAG: peptidoglycan synthetase [Sphingobacteriales bacterium]|nr:MAG: peptidoglycan synthetase [Sphingobacteriales bacterium]
MKIHLIAIGGSIMHNLAIALHKKRYKVTGSDDAIYEPAYSRLQKNALLPENMGWERSRITSDLDLVILGMHAKPDNPELDEARLRNVKIVSFPEFIFEQSKEKLRVVIAGSHGKTTVTSMIMHVLQKAGLDFDYAVGSTISGFEDSVKLTEKAPLIIIEGDEYLTSPIDRRPKFLWYKPQIAVINGVAWDHINVFPTYEEYLNQFVLLLESMQSGAKLVYPATDNDVKNLVDEHARNLQSAAALLPGHEIIDGKTVVHIHDEKIELSVFGKHNLQNLAVASHICSLLKIPQDKFWIYAADFKGAGKRMEAFPNKKGITVYRDFAHAPSKVQASTLAVREQYPQKKLVAMVELHTFSSLNAAFIHQYAATLAPADYAIVYVDKHAVEAKGGSTYSHQQLCEAFARQDLIFVDSAEKLEYELAKFVSEKNVMLLMSSGNLGGLDLHKLLD